MKESPSVKTKQDNSIPSRKPSITTSLLADPNFLFFNISTRLFFAFSSSLIIKTPLPAASPFAFKTYGGLIDSK